ncbi:MAG TPA: sigma-54 dependent transcriptional regulator [bacterium]|nr:sigma-54 dependent transcriptional regulator [bacterium]HPN45861.1 sigma-54 dependent transcriptional regulator [bacterium]
MHNQLGKILIVDDNEDILTAAKLLLKKEAKLVHTEKEPHNIPALLKNESYDIILLDMNFTRDVTSGSEGFHWLNEILRIDPSVIIILMTAYGDVDLAVRAMKAGASDFILKPWQNEKLLATLSVAMNLRQSRLEIDKLRTRQQQLSADLDQNYHDMVGSSAVMLKVFTAISRVAGTDANVLIMGENGTGKELVARALHRQSLRADDVFISVDMGAISETLFESELFGHMRGAFTDAKNDKAGRFEVASGGTLFLDEIGNLSLAMQAKLLRVLEDRQVIRLGSNQQRPIDIRLICATNMPLYDMIAKKEFRQDFLYRINTVEIHLPPLRERKEDIPLLVHHFLAIYAKKYKKPALHISAGALAKLQQYPWPGNVRELCHALERAVIMTDKQVLQPEDFTFQVAHQQQETAGFNTFNLDEIEKTMIRKVMELCGDNISQAAQKLGITRSSLYRRMEKHGL